MTLVDAMDRTAARANARERFVRLDHRLSLEDYNYRHFRARHLLGEARRALADFAPRPGEEAPDFELPASIGPDIRLSDLRGRPVLLHFGSFS
jgi:hypothetical protein